MALAVQPVRLVPAVDRAARVLAFLEAEERPLGISEIARRLSASKGSVRDVLETLRSHGLLARDETSKRYRLGPRLARLGSVARERLDLPLVARPHLARLAEESGETVLLLVRQANRALILEKAESGQAAMRVSAPVGRRIPLLAGAVGKLFLAYADRADRERHLAQLPRFTDRTVMARAAYERDLAAVERAGFALDDQEYLDGVRAAGAPVFDAAGSLAAVLLVVGLAGSLTADRLLPIARRAAEVAADISRALGAPDGARGRSGERPPRSA